MKNSVMLTITSLLLLLFLTFHLADDIVHGFEEGGLSNLVGGVLITSSGCTEFWCLPNGDRGTSSCSSGRSFRWSSPSST